MDMRIARTEDSRYYTEVTPNTAHAPAAVHDTTEVSGGQYVSFP